MVREFQMDFGRAVTQFRAAMKNFPIKKTLYRTLFRGKGIEFDSYRKFDDSSEDYSMVDWKASLRANDLLAKKYIEEKDLNIYFVIDVSNSMLFGSGAKLKAEYVGEMVAAISNVITMSGDNVGLILFTDHIMQILRPSRGRNQFGLVTKLLSDVTLYGGNFDMRVVIDYILRTIRPSFSVFVIISDFIRTHKDCDRHFRLLGTRFETMAMMVRDPLDEILPDTSHQLIIQDPYSGEQMIIDSVLAAERYKAQVLKQKAQMKKILQDAKIDLLDLNTSVPFVLPVVSFLRRRTGGLRE
ncbi:hypothetical protein CMI37_11970 [Candidatus Pacearchaeota archaeon]|nr:hypothetical protein [Candidatus Pacearchaeota archaeon]|tara:strand:+ start:1717 stop:2610 length:894 start_codon:yes stop_codon:yes gene_type:complete